MKPNYLQNPLLVPHNVVKGKIPVVLDFSNSSSSSQQLTREVMSDRNLRKRIMSFLETIGIAKALLTVEGRKAHSRHVDPAMMMVERHVKLTIDWYVFGVSGVLSTERAGERDRKFLSPDEVIGLYWRVAVPEALKIEKPLGERTLPQPPKPPPSQPVVDFTRQPVTETADNKPDRPAGTEIVIVRVGVRDQGRLIQVSDLLSDVSTFDEVKTATSIVYGSDKPASQVARFLIAEGLIVRVEKGKYQKVCNEPVVEPVITASQPATSVAQPALEPAKPDTAYATLDAIRQKLARLGWLKDAIATKKQRLYELEKSAKAISEEVLGFERELETLEAVERAWQALQTAASA